MIKKYLTIFAFFALAVCVAQTSITLDETNTTINDDGVITATTIFNEAVAIDVVIPTLVNDIEVKAIGESAMSPDSYGSDNTDRTLLLSLTLPSTLDSIAEQAFKNNRSLTQVNGLEDSNVRYIAKNAFKSTSLTSISLPESLEYIGNSAFQAGKATYSSVTIPSKVYYIGKEAFKNGVLTSLVLPDEPKPGFNKWIDNSDNKVQYDGGTTITDITLSYTAFNPNTTSIDDFSKRYHKIKIYPNPVENKLKIVAKEKIETISLYNDLGKLLGFYRPLATDFGIDFTLLSEGFYVVVLTDQNGRVFTKKVLK